MWGRKKRQPPNRAGPPPDRDIDLSEIIPLVRLEKIKLPERLADHAPEVESKEETASRTNISRFLEPRIEEEESRAAQEREREERTAVASGYNTDLEAGRLASEIMNNA